MRIIQTVNDTIRLLFNPKTEIFCLSDFLLVRDNSENFLAQVVEVYDDKFDQEANVAKIRLVYRIVNGNEIVPYDNYTPSRECEVAKIKQTEIEKCINLGKKTINIGVSTKTKEKTEINTDFLDNNCVIFSDKFEQTNQIFENLAPRLATYKHVLILDFSGTCSPENALSFVASDSFKLPLSSDTIDYIQQKTLLRAKLETQVVLGDVFEEVKKYLLTAEENYIPFSKFIKVIQSQCKQTPSVELLVLISWLKKYSRMGIFAKNKREFETLFKSVEKNKITTVDFSSVKIEWQKEYVEYITNNISQDVFVMIRLNDNNINNDIINNIYLKKKNISFIPCFSYGYKKAPYLMEFAQNYILMPTLNPKRDFAHANFQIQSLNKDSYMIYGEDTKDFIFTLEHEVPVKKQVRKEETGKGKMFISLNLQLEDMTALELRPNDFEVKQAEPKKRRLHEEIRLIDVLSAEDKLNQKEENNQNDSEKISEIEEKNAAVFAQTLTGEIKEPNLTSEIQPIEQYVEEQNEEGLQASAILEDELDYFEQETIEQQVSSIETVNEKEENFEEAQKESYQEEMASYDENPEESLSDEELNLIEEQVQDDEETMTEEDEEEETSKEDEETTSNELLEPEEDEENVSIPEENPDEDELKEDEDEATSNEEEAVSDEENLDEESIASVNEDETTSEEDEEDEEDVSDDEEDEEKKAIEAAKIKLQEFAESRISKEETEPVIEETKDAVSDIINEVKEKAKEKKAAVKKPKAKEEVKEKEAAAPKKRKTTKKEEIEEEVKPEKPAKKKRETKKEADEKKENTKDSNIEESEIESLQSEDENLKETKKIESSDIEETEEISEEEAIDKKFEEIMNDTKAEKAKNGAIQIDEKVSIDLEKIKKEIKKPENKLPVFNGEDEENNAPIVNFKEGDKVSHEKYGTGEIMKVIKYGQRCLLQIEFPEIGKRLLDPKIAKLKMADE